jgi:hypothetical protein
LAQEETIATYGGFLAGGFTHVISGREIVIRRRELGCGFKQAVERGFSTACPYSTLEREHDVV